MQFWENSPGYAIARGYVDLCTMVGCSRIRIEGRENLPENGAVLLASNHCASLMDPLVELRLRPRRPLAYGARSDVFSGPTLTKVLRWLKILPIARERNGLHEVAKNFDTFDEAVECIGHGTPFCLYVEGRHRAERGMLPVRKGIFRLARMAVAKLEGPVWVVPVGVDYEYLFREGGAVVVTIGEPVEMRSYFEGHSAENEAEVYHGLCESFQTRIESLIGHIAPQSEIRTGKPSPAALALKLLGAFLLIPLEAALLLSTVIYWLPARLIMRKMADKAWTHTVFYAVRFVLPVLWPLIWLEGIVSNYLFEILNYIKK